jgi:EamA domain-containing membrane protein RarD
VDSSGNQNLPPDIVQWLWFGWCWKPLQDALGYQLMPLMVWVVGLGHQFF